VERATQHLGSSSARPQRRMPFWLIARDGASWWGPLTTRLADGRRALCVFSFEEEARLFLDLGAEDGWRVRAIGIGELVSVLSGPCGQVELVVLDPLPQREAGVVNRLLCVDRERFVAFLMRKGSGHQKG
jgi:hypothetical protein